jgi:transcription termination factor Rho
LEIETMSQNSKVEGVLEVTPKGFGFLRSIEKGYSITSEDTYVGQAVIKRFNLKPGMYIVGQGSKKGGSRPNFSLDKIETVDGLSPQDVKKLEPFSRLTVIDPEEKLHMETGSYPLTTRVVDLFTPIGMGQRALIVSPPKAGKTIFIEDMAKGLKQNHSHLKLFIFLIDERPEEVTQFRREVDGEVVATSFDSPLKEQIRMSELVLNRVMRLVEAGYDVALIVDSLTRLGRAFNKASETRGKTLSGGVSADALQFPRKFFGAARNIEDGGSLTIIATCLVDTGSRMDEVIFQEFKGTGNTELVLDRSLANEKVFPAVNLRQSGTRKEEKLQSSDDLKRIWTLVKALANDRGYEKYKTMLDKMEDTESNKEFLSQIPAS